MVGAEFFLGEGRHGEGEEQEEGFHSLSQHRKNTYTHKKTHAYTRVSADSAAKIHLLLCAADAFAF